MRTGGLACACTLLVAGALACSGDDADDTAVQIGGTTVTKADVDARVDAQLAAIERRDGETARAAYDDDTLQLRLLRHQTAQQLAADALLDARVRECGTPCVVTDAEVDKEIASMVRTRFKGDEAALVRAYEAQGFTAETFRASIRRSLEMRALVAHEASQEPAPSDAVLRRMYAANTYLFGIPAGKAVYHVYLPKSRKALAERLAAGADADSFPALVRRYSTDRASKARGGYIGTLNRSPLPENVERLAGTLDSGEVASRPLRADGGGWQILYVERQAGDVPAFGAVKEKVRALAREAQQQEIGNRIIAEFQEQIDAADFDGAYAPPAASSAEPEADPPATVPDVAPRTTTP